jgi:cysteine-rich repeat protein
MPYACEWAGAPTCGNNHADAGEECDDGNSSSGDGCDGSCVSESGAQCGTGAVLLGAPGSGTCTCPDGLTPGQLGIAALTVSALGFQVWLQAQGGLGGGDDDNKR